MARSEDPLDRRHFLKGAAVGAAAFFTKGPAANAQEAVPAIRGGAPVPASGAVAGAQEVASPGEQDGERSLALGVSVSKQSVAVNGLDPVILFTQATEVPGSPEYAVQHTDGATYLFTSAANRDEFLRNPATYEPAFGGFCGWGVVEYRDVADTERRVNIPHARPSRSSAYLVTQVDGSKRIVGFLNQRMRERFLTDPVFYEKRALMGWELQQINGLVPWSEVADEVRAMRAAQEAYRQIRIGEIP